MPTYVYRCRDCGRQFEHFEKMSSRTKTRRCPACGGRGERQISGGAGFLFRGEGFYITDYRSEDYRKKEKAESGSKEPAKAGSAAESATPGAAERKDASTGAEPASDAPAPKPKPEPRSGKRRSPKKKAR